MSWLPVVPAVLPLVQLSDSLPPLPPHSSASVGEGCSAVTANPAATATTPASFFIRRDFLLMSRSPIAIDAPSEAEPSCNEDH